MLEVIGLLAETATNGTGTETVTDNGINWKAVLDIVVKWATTTGIRLIIALLIMIISFKIINVVSRRIWWSKSLAICRKYHAHWKLQSARRCSMT